MRGMTVGQIKELIADVSDDTELYQIVGDHQARGVDLSQGKIVDEGDGNFSEYFGDEFLEEGDMVHSVLLVD